MHGFGAEVFADAGAQHGAAIGKSGVGGGAGTFELDIPQAAIFFQLAHGGGTAIAQLACPDTKLVAGVNQCDWLCLRGHCIGTHYLQHLWAVELLWVYAQLLGECSVDADHAGLLQPLHGYPTAVQIVLMFKCIVKVVLQLVGK